MVSCIYSANAIEVLIPEVNGRFTDEFILDSVAKLDDFIEDIRAKENIKGTQSFGFASASVVQLGIATGSLMDYFLTPGRGIVTFIDGVKKAGGLGSASMMPTKLADFSRRWMFLVSTGQVASAAIKEKIFTVHVDDLALFREILSTIRQKQAALLVGAWKEQTRERLLNIDRLILEARPSFKRIYDFCSVDPFEYKKSVMIDIYSKSLWDYFKLLTMDSSYISAQMAAGLMSPTVNAYLSQEVLPHALKKCFQVSSENVGTFKDEGSQFVATLLALDGASKFVVIASIISIVKFEELRFGFDKFSPTGSLKAMGNVQVGWLSKIVEPVKMLVSKVSPALIRKIMVVTQVGASGFNLYSISKDYKAAKEEAGARRTEEEFRKYVSQYFQARALLQIKELEKILNDDKQMDTSDRTALENEIRKWRAVEAEFKSYES